MRILYQLTEHGKLVLTQILMETLSCYWSHNDTNGIYYIYTVGNPDTLELIENLVKYSRQINNLPIKKELVCELLFLYFFE
jgi:hypothetical protein